MRSFTKVVLVLLVCLSLWTGKMAHAEQNLNEWIDTQSNQEGETEETPTVADDEEDADAIQNAEDGSNDDILEGSDDAPDANLDEVIDGAVDVNGTAEEAKADDGVADDNYDIVADELLEEAPEVWDVVLLIPNEGTNEVLSEKNLPMVKLTAALIVNALSGTNAKVTVVGTVSETDGQVMSEEINARDPNAVANVVAALEAMPIGSGNKETTYLREKVDALAGEENQPARLVVVLMDGKNHDSDDSKFANMDNRDKTSRDDFRMLFLGLNSDDTATGFDKKTIGQLTDNQYSEADYLSPIEGMDEDLAMGMANRVLDVLGLDGYNSRELSGSDVIEQAKVLLKNPVYFIDGQVDGESSEQEEDANESKAASEETLEKEDVQSADNSKAETADTAAGSFSIDVGKWTVTDIAPVSAQSGRVLWNGAKPVEIQLTNINDIEPESGDVEIQATVLVGDKETDLLPISYTLNGEPLADAEISADLLAEAGEYTVTASVDIADFNISEQAEESFRVLCAPVFVGEQTQFQITDTVDAPNVFTILEDRFALFTDPNGEDISTVEVTLSDDALTNVSVDGLALQGDVTKPETELTATLTATNEAGYNTEQRFDIVLTSVPAIISDTELEINGLQSEYIEGDPVEASLGLTNSSYRDLMMAVDKTWLDHVTVYVSVNGETPIAAEGNIDGWAYTTSAAAGENTLRAWLTVDSIAPESFNMNMEASAQANYAVMTLEEVLTATHEQTEEAAIERTEQSEEEPADESEEEPAEEPEEEPVEEEPVEGSTEETEEEPEEKPKEEPADEPAGEPLETSVAEKPESPSFIDRLINTLGLGGMAALCAGIVVLILAIVLVIKRIVAPHFDGMLYIKVETKSNAYTSNPIDLSEWGKKTVNFGNLMGQSGLPPISMLTSGDIAEKLQFKPARDGILIINKTRSLRGEDKQTVTNQNAAKYIVQDNRILFTYKR